MADRAPNQALRRRRPTRQSAALLCHLRRPWVRGSSAAFVLRAAPVMLAVRPPGDTRGAKKEPRVRPSAERAPGTEDMNHGNPGAV